MILIVKPVFSVTDRRGFFLQSLAMMAGTRTLFADDKVDDKKDVEVFEAKLQSLTPEENKTLNEALKHTSEFLKKYTKNETYNLGSIPRFQEGMVRDRKGVRDVAATFPEGIERELGLAYDWPDITGIAHYEVRDRTEREITQFLKEMGVDPKTAKTSDDKKDVESYVTRDILLAVEKQIRTVKSSLEKELGEKIAFPQGFTLKLLHSIGKNDVKSLVGTEIVFLAKENSKTKN